MSHGFKVENKVVAHQSFDVKSAYMDKCLDTVTLTGTMWSIDPHGSENWVPDPVSLPEDFTTTVPAEVGVIQGDKLHIHSVPKVCKNPMAITLSTEALIPLLSVLKQKQLLTASTNIRDEHFASKDLVTVVNFDTKPGNKVKKATIPKKQPVIPLSKGFDFE